MFEQTILHTRGRPARALAMSGMMAFTLGAFGYLSGTAEAAQTYSFNNITGNSATDAATGESQLSVTVADAGAGLVSFTFNNSGPNASSIADLYWDDGELLGIASITDSGAGVSFSQGAAPGNLPGGNTIDFNTTAGFSADSDSPVQPNGVNPGEFVVVTFNLINGATFQDILDSIALSHANPGVDVTGGLRIGIHVQGFAGGGSESFVNNGPNQIIPEPSTFALAIGCVTPLAAIGLIRRRRRANSGAS